MTRALRVAVVSPFLDKRHGTERCVAEQVERLAHEYQCEILVYSEEVVDVPIDEGPPSPGRIAWRKVPSIRGPHLFRFAWWFVANHLVRFKDRRAGRFVPDLVYTPGTNCLDADVIGIHIVFAEFYAQVGERLRLLRNPFLSWPRLLHRKLYYRSIIALENRIYRNERILLAGVADKVSKDLLRSFGRSNGVRVIYHGADAKEFNLAMRAGCRSAARRDLGLSESMYALLLAGNDWNKKGVATLFAAMAQAQNPSLCALIRGQDDPAPFRPLIHQYDLDGRVQFLPSRPDVGWYYAAADAYVGPSIEDSFALPPLEAMACGLPVIVSRQMGVSEIITHGVDGLVLEDATDIKQLARLINRLFAEPQFAKSLGANAVHTASRYTWDTNAAQLFQMFQDALHAK